MDFEYPGEIVLLVRRNVHPSENMKLDRELSLRYDSRNFPDDMPALVVHYPANNQDPQWLVIPQPGDEHVTHGPWRSRGPVLRGYHRHIGEQVRIALDSSRLHRELDWDAKVSLKDGLARTVDYYRKTVRSA